MRVVALFLSLACLALAAGCGGESGSPEGGSPDAPKSERVTFRGPGGKVAVDTHVDLSELGVATYPGAQLVEDDGGGLTRVETPDVLSLTARFRTDASIEEIVDFYQEELGAETSVMTGDSALLMVEKEPGLTVQVIVGEDEDGREIVVATTRAKSE